MAKKANLKDPLGNILYPYTLVDSVRDETGRVLSSLVLRKDNTTEFIPSADYHPSTKKYVDETAATKQPKITSSGILMGNGSGGVSAATANTDYLPVSNANLKGTPTAPTAAKGTNTTQIATTAFVQNALSGISAKGFEFGTTAPTNTNLLWIDTTNGSILKYYNGSAWTAVNAVFK